MVYLYITAWRLCRERGSKSLPGCLAAWLHLSNGGRVVVCTMRVCASVCVRVWCGSVARRTCRIQPPASPSPDTQRAGDSSFILALDSNGKLDAPASPIATAISTLGCCLPCWAASAPGDSAPKSKAGLTPVKSRRQDGGRQCHTSAFAGRRAAPSCAAGARHQPLAAAGPVSVAVCGRPSSELAAASQHRPRPLPSRRRGAGHGSRCAEGYMVPAGRPLWRRKGGAVEPVTNLSAASCLPCAHLSWYQRWH